MDSQTFKFEFNLKRRGHSIIGQLHVFVVPLAISTILVVPQRRHGGNSLKGKLGMQDEVQGSRQALG